MEQVSTMLIRDSDKGLGFSIAGGRGSDRYVEDSDSVFISKVTEGGAADKDGKLRVGDRIMMIGSSDVSGAEHAHVVELLTGMERFVRLVVERKADPSNPSAVTTPATTGYHGGSTGKLLSQPSLSSLGTLGGDGDAKSPKVFGHVKPYGGLYTSNSYMANRPSFMRTREPGQYGLTATSTSSSPGAASTTTSSYSKLPGLSAMPGVSYAAGTASSSALPESRTLPDMGRRSSASSAVGKTVSLPRKGANEEEVGHFFRPLAYTYTYATHMQTPVLFVMRAGRWGRACKRSA